MQDKTRKLISYWQELNRFSPVTISNAQPYNEYEKRANHIHTGNFISLGLGEENSELFEKLVRKVFGKPEIEVVVGQVEHKRLYKLIDKKINDPESQFKPVDGDCGQSFVFYLKLNAQGHYQKGSLKVSEFLRAACSLAFSDLPSAKAIAKQLDQKVKPDDPITPKDLKYILKCIFESLQIGDQISGLNVDCDNDGKPDWKIYLKLLLRSESQHEAILQMDFYSSDLEMLSQADLDGHFLEDFILSKPLGSRTKIDTSPQALIKLTLPQHHSAGKWPSEYNPTLMQKVAINIATGQNPPAVFSVNGPPGTGKTTLLKEIVANAVVEKAKILARMIDGENGLRLKKINAGTVNKGAKYYYQLPDELKSHSIIVASNNNAAVENISRDLPLAFDVKEKNKDTGMGLFHIKQHPEVYFTSKAFDLFNDSDKKANQNEEYVKDPTSTGGEPVVSQKQTKVFGLISAPYGKSKNIDCIADILPMSDAVFEGFDWGLPSKPNLGQALSEFKRALTDFEDIKESLIRLVEQYQNVTQKLNAARSGLDGNDLAELEQKKERYSQKLDDIEIEKDTQERKLQNLLNSRSVQDKATSLISKIKSVFGAGRKMSGNEAKIAELNELIDDLGLKRKSIKARLDQVKAQLVSYKSIDDLQQELDALKMQPIFAGVTVFDEVKFSKANITGEEVQTLCPWVTDELNEANIRLFHAALQLTKAYICNNEGIFENLKHFAALRGPMSKLGYDENEVTSVRKEAFHTLNLLIPVLSTTFASVQSAFSVFGKGELGTVIIDESGQATPYSALGLLYRSRRCIVVGDPLQVEPIFGTPQTLIRTAYNQMGLSEGEQTEFNVAGSKLSYGDAAVSVQVMADACNPYYGAIGNTEVGCPLVVHRRCQSPMFDISNEISYDQRMIKKVGPLDKNKCLALKRNEWIDDDGKERGNKDHFVASQGNKVLQLLREAQENMGDPMLVFEPGKLFVISPFKTVAKGVKDAVEEAFNLKDEHGEHADEVENNSNSNKKTIKKWKNTSIGTVHTFQGKEADCVILVLGADEEAKIAAEWASSQANILNVAVTRAKYRLVIIGNEKLWGQLKYFNVALAKLKETEQPA